MRNVSRWRLFRLTLLAVVTTTVTLAAVPVAATAPGAASTPTAEGSVSRPDDDPFYSVPRGIRFVHDGTVLRWRRLPAEAMATPAPAKVWQLLYKTTDNHGVPTATVGTLLVPTTHWAAKGPRPLVSYQIPEDGLATKCAPSYLLRAGAEPSGPTEIRFDQRQIKDAVERGWSVIVPDYEGPASQFLGAAAAAHGILDGIRAARSFAPAQISHRAPLGLWGYSGGGFATAAAAQVQPEYAPELELRGIAMGGVIADFNASLQAISGQPFSGWVPFGLAALRRSHPQADINQYLSPSGVAYADAVQHECAGTAVASGPYFAPLSTFEASPGSLSAGAFPSFAHRVSLIGLPGTPTAPVYLYHGVTDELVPITAVRQLAHRYRAAGAKVFSVEHDKDHAAEQSYGVPGAVTFLTQRLSMTKTPPA